MSSFQNKRQGGRRVPYSSLFVLGLGAFGLSWSITTVAAYVPPFLGRLTESGTLIGLILALEGLIALSLPLLVGPVSDATQSSLGRRRPFMLLALPPMAAALAAVGFMSSLQAVTLALIAFFFAYYVYEPPYRSLYPDRLPSESFGRAQGVQHLLRGVALAGALVGGGFLFALWPPAPFLLAAAVTVVACGATVVLVREDGVAVRDHRRLRSAFAAPWRVVRREASVRRFLIANTAWEATFAGVRTFVVLYIIEGLDQPLYVSSVVLAVVAAGYVLSAAMASRFGDLFGLGRVIAGASVIYGLALLSAAFATSWHWWYVVLVAVGALAGGTVMTLAWGLLFRVMPATDTGTISGLVTTTKGAGLIAGPLGVGAAIDIFRPSLQSTDGYAVVWPVVAIPILLVVPIVILLAREEERRRPSF